MRYVHIGLVVVVTAIVLLFKIENMTAVTVSLFGISTTMPVFLLVIVVYVLGMLTGSSLLALTRALVKRAAR
jgi:uncharacterized integral membrane protein